MLVRQAFRYELDPNVQQRILLAKHAGAARFAYHWGWARRMELYQQTKTSTHAIEQHRALNRLKQPQYPWLYEVSKCAPQEALRDVDRAVANFFRGLQQGRPVGWPRFRKKGQADRFRLTGTIRVVGRAVQLPRLGRSRLKEEPQVQGRILSATVRREADRWYVSLQVETERPDPAPVDGPAVGIDGGIASFATIVGDDGTAATIEAPRPLQRALRLLRRRQRQHSRQQKGSKNRRQSALRLARLHRRLRNIRQDFWHNLTTHLAKTKRVIVVEDLNVRGLLRNPHWARQIADRGWGEFRRMLAYKCPWYGSRLVVAKRYYPSTKTCSACGHVVKALPLDVREWDCPGCGTHHDRDVNAARNLLSMVPGE